MLINEIKLPLRQNIQNFKPTNTYPMRKIFLTIMGAILFSSAMFAQNNSLKTRLSAIYSEQTVHSILSNNARKGYYEYLLNESYHVASSAPKEGSEVSKIYAMQKLVNGEKIEVSVEDMIEEYKSGSFNILAYDFPRNYSKGSYYRLGDSNFLLVLHPLSAYSKK